MKESQQNMASAKLDKQRKSYHEKMQKAQANLTSLSKDDVTKTSKPEIEESLLDT